MDQRLGYTLPLRGLRLDRQAEIVADAERMGYSDAWSSEVDGLDAFTPLALAATATETTRLGTAIVSPFTRGAMTLAMSAAAMAELAPGRFCLGLGAASNVIVERWNNATFERPRSRVRDMTQILRAAFAGERVSLELDTISVSGLRLSRRPEQPIPIFIAALRERMLRLAGEVGDGVLLNWLGAEDVPRVLEEVRAGERAGDDASPTEVVCRVFLAPGDPAQAEFAARRALTAYMTVPVYAKFHDWLGRGAAMAPMAAAWAEGRRREAPGLVDDQMLHDLVIIGDAQTTRRRVQRYFETGVDTVVLEWLPTAEPAEMAELVQHSLRDLAPRAT